MRRNGREITDREDIDNEALQPTIIYTGRGKSAPGGFPFGDAGVVSVQPLPSGGDL